MYKVFMSMDPYKLRWHTRDVKLRWHTRGIILKIKKYTYIYICLTIMGLKDGLSILKKIVEQFFYYFF
jgi:hypothetical protein